MTITSSAKARLALASSLTVFLLAGPAFAADPGQAARPPSACATPAAHASVTARHIKHLHDQLKITPDEESQWGNVAQVMLDNAAAMDSAMKDRAGKVGTMTAVEDLDSYQAIVAAHADGLKKLEAAFAPLYAAMPAAQQKVADAVFGHRTAARLHAHG